MAVPPLQGQGACLFYHLISFNFTSCAGRKTRYTYVVMYEIVDGEERPHGLSKIDLTASSPAAAATISFGRGRSGGEAVFIPSSTNPAELKGAQFASRLITCLTVQHCLTTSRPCLCLCYTRLPCKGKCTGWSLIGIIKLPQHAYL